MIPIEFKLLGGAGLLVGAFFLGHEYSERAWSERVAKAESEQAALVIELERTQKQAEYLLLDSVNDILEQEDEKTGVIYREKIIYRDSPGAGTCKFPARGVQIINDSAGLPRVPPASDDVEAKAKAKAVSDIEVVGVVSANYRMCVKELAKFQGLWDWAESVYNNK